MLSRSQTSAAVLALLLSSCVPLGGAQELFYKINSTQDIINSTRTLAYDLMSHYNGNESGQIPGILPGPPSSGLGPYHWWQAGAMMGTFMDYWHLTNDSTYNDVVTQAMLFQVGPELNYMPPNQTGAMGNDDQAFWGLSAMLAAENKFPNPPPDQPQWLELAENLWNSQADPSRHDDECNGGMRWQVPFFNGGYNYKNSIANGCFFNIGARLARYTKNDTYAQYAERTWDWLWGVGYIDNENWHVYDGAHVEYNCTDINKLKVSYNPAVLVQGAAFMYNYTDGDEKWRYRVDNMLTGLLDVFFPNNTGYEHDCEPKGECTTDMISFKGYAHRWLGVVAQIAPFTRKRILPVLRDSATAAIKQCTGAPTGRKCGFYWTKGYYVDVAIDNTDGLGETMDVFAAVMSLLMDKAEPPATSHVDGISKGNPYDGRGDGDGSTADRFADRGPRRITAGDKAGASILTILIIGGGTAAFMWITVL